MDSPVTAAVWHIAQPGSVLTAVVMNILTVIFKSVNGPSEGTCMT